MANIGMRYVVYAPLTEENEVAGTYTYGTGKILAKAIKADLKLNVADVPLYADDGESERAREFIDGDLTLTCDDLSQTVRVDLLGNKETSETIGSDEVTVLESSTEDTPTHVGIGYIQSKIESGARKYRAILFTKVQFAEPDDTAETKGQQIAWQTPTIIGKLSRRVDTNWKEEITVTSLATAKAFLNNRLNVQTT